MTAGLDAMGESLMLQGFDIGVLAVVGISSLIGLVRGFVREMLSLIGFVASLYLTFYLYEPVAEQLKPHISSETMAKAAAVGGSFIACLVVFSILNLIIVKLIKLAQIGSIDRSLGFAFGLARGAFIICIGYMMYSLIIPEKEQPEGVTSASSFRLVKIGALALAEAAPSVAGDLQDLSSRMQEQLKGKESDLEAEGKEGAEGASGVTPSQHFISAILLRPDFARLGGDDRQLLRDVAENMPALALGTMNAENMPSHEAANILVNLVRLQKQIARRRGEQAATPEGTSPDAGSDGAENVKNIDETALNRVEEKLIAIYTTTRDAALEQEGLMTPESEPEGQAPQPNDENGAAPDDAAF